MYVTVVCDNGEIKINTALLVILYTIFGNLVRGLKESTVILIKGIQEEDLIPAFPKTCSTINRILYEGRNYLSNPINFGDT